MKELHRKAKLSAYSPVQTFWWSPSPGDVLVLLDRVKSTVIATPRPLPFHPPRPWRPVLTWWRLRGRAMDCCRSSRRSCWFLLIRKRPRMEAISQVNIKYRVGVKLLYSTSSSRQTGCSQCNSGSCREKNKWESIDAVKPFKAAAFQDLRPDGILRFKKQTDEQNLNDQRRSDPTQLSRWTALVWVQTSGFGG